MPARQLLITICVCSVALLAACGAGPDASQLLPESSRADLPNPALRALYGRLVQGVYLEGGVEIAPLYAHKINTDRRVRLQVADAQAPTGWSTLSEQTVSNFGFFYFNDLPAEQAELKIEVLDAKGQLKWADSASLAPAGQVTFLYIDETLVLAETAQPRFIGVHLSGEATLGDEVIVEDGQGGEWATAFDSANWAWVSDEDLAEGDYTLHLAQISIDVPLYAPVVECLSDSSWSLSLQGQGALIDVQRPDAASMSQCTCKLNCSNY